ncbi:lysophospholipid acyltransferase family protein [Persicitalea sp.]|uniref:lysophospholipid acyltransferase family protein n=1 Tax=Persicitalea sp. TaxID=3100273 RepID=UPI0035948F72
MSQPRPKFYIRLLDRLSGVSWKSIYRLSSALNFLLYRVVPYRQKVIFQNLRRSFPGKNEDEIRAIARRYYRHLADTIFETVKYRSCPAEEILERIEGDIGLVDRLYTEGKNVLFLMGHRGNWELANLFSSLRFSHECLVVYRPLANRDFDQWFLDLRTRFGAKMVPMNDIAAELRKPRRKPYVVVLANDQSPPPESAFWTTFLHQDTGFFRGGEILARRNDLTVLYADFSRIEAKRGFYHVEISLICDECKTLPRNGVLEKQIRLLESDIRAQPFNWLWSHRRWKHKRPS